MLDGVRVFIKVAEHGSFSKAGNTLGLSPSSISRQVDRLESQLGVKLFQRSTRHLSLTEAGHNLLDGTKKLLSDFDGVLASMQYSQNEPEGHLRISVFESFGRQYICPLLPQFLLLYPKVNVEIALEHRLVDLYKDEVDLAIRIGPPEDSSLRMRRLVINRMVVCASPGYLEKYEAPTHPQDLSQHNCLVLQNNRQTSWWHFRKKRDYLKVQVSGNLVSSGGTPLLEAAKQGLGIMMMSEWMVKEQLRTGELVTLLDTWQPALHEGRSNDIYAMFIDNKYMKPALRRLIDFITQHINL